MNDLGDILGSLMTGLIRARQAADLQTAALAELYKDNPLLEGLSVPRVRIPEVSIDLPLIIESHEAGEEGELNEPSKVVDATSNRLKNTLANTNIKLSTNFQKAFADTAKLRLTEARKNNDTVSKELVSRTVQDAFVETLKKTNTELSAQDKLAIVKDIRTEAGLAALAKPSIPQRILTNIRTADIKDKATGNSVVRLKITLTEEGVEWVTQSNDAGGVNRTLTPE
ncbi:hypothetical protein NQT62_11150 [Limnobacter humi]|uniref:Amidase n=1 Tax=Limnobacter humi TaxID=1778671 RepID=A0ABT1WHI0_9BURK|nr:hypothetical protein [Limnobacter humi]MCQ8896989.1 hypothetical protein [Limnobacter humi]